MLDTHTLGLILTNISYKQRMDLNAFKNKKNTI